MEFVFAADTLAEFFQETLLDANVAPGTLAKALAALVHALLLGSFFGLPGGVFIWGERKLAGRIQDRLGPTRVGGRFGWMQPLADGLKLVQKEDLIPASADGMLFRIAPYIVLAASFAALMVLPFSDGWVAVSLDIGLFLIFAILSLEVVGVILGGYASGSKWALYGAIREAAQMVSYEIPMALCALVPVIAAGSLNLGEIGRVQSGWFINWLVFHDPFTFIAFFAYFTCAIASCKRSPFDLAEAESELVAGFLTEYSGMRWSLFFLSEYTSMFIVSGIATMLFLGGWNLGLPYLQDGTGGFLVNLFGMIVFLAKSSLLVLVQIWVRWTLPRLRIDQVMTTCLKYLIPISCVLFLGAVVWPLAVMALFGRTTVLMSSDPLAERIVRPAAVAPESTGHTTSLDLFVPERVPVVGPNAYVAGKEE